MGVQEGEESGKMSLFLAWSGDLCPWPAHPSAERKAFLSLPSELVTCLSLSCHLQLWGPGCVLSGMEATSYSLLLRPHFPSLPCPGPSTLMVQLADTAHLSTPQGPLHQGEESRWEAELGTPLPGLRGPRHMGGLFRATV